MSRINSRRKEAQVNRAEALRRANDALKSFNNEQRSRLSLALKTGSIKGLNKKIVERVIPPAVIAMEAENALKRKPYKPGFTHEQRAELKRQFEDLIFIVYPKASMGHVEKLVNTLLERTSTMEQSDVIADISEGNIEGAFKKYNCYSEDTRRKIEIRGQKLKIKPKKYEMPKFIGFNGKRATLAGAWTRKKYFYTAPFHEAAHFLLGGNEFKVHLTEYFYSLKRGIMSEHYLRKRKIFTPQMILARIEAIHLYREGKANGWEKAESELRKFIFARQ